MQGEAQPIEVVIDTNIWLDILVFDDPRSRRLASLLLPPARVRPLASDEMRAELADVITRPQFLLDDARQAALLAARRPMARSRNLRSSGSRQGSRQSSATGAGRTIAS